MRVIVFLINITVNSDQYGSDFNPHMHGEAFEFGETGTCELIRSFCE
jgi:hypothetical protein